MTQVKMQTRIVLLVTALGLILLLIGIHLPTPAWVFVAGSLCGIGLSVPLGIGAIIAIDLWRCWQVRTEGYTP